MMLIRETVDIEGFIDTASGPQCHLPGQNCIENW